MVELVIKIPKELYEVYKGRPPMLGDAEMDMIAQLIANGTPLPEHGRLIDKDKMIEDLLTVNPQFHYLVDWCLMVTEAQSTIIEGSESK